MSRRSDQLKRIEASLARLEEAVAGHASVLRDQVTAARVEVKNVASSADAALAGVQALAGAVKAASITRTTPEPSPAPSQTAAGGSADGEPATAARRAPKTLKPRDGE